MALNMSKLQACGVRGEAPGRGGAPAPYPESAAAARRAGRDDLSKPWMRTGD